MAAKTKNTKRKKPYLMELSEKIERIRNAELSDMNLFELSIHCLMPSDVFREIKTRLLQIKLLLESGDIDAAIIIVDGLLSSPQKRDKKF